MPALARPEAPIAVALPPRQANLAGQCDVLVVGGGPAGLGAALGAAAAGARTILVERYGFLDQIGIGSPPIELVNAGRLIAHIDRSWDRRRSLVRRIDANLPGIQASARQTHELMLGLLPGQAD
jgi:glycine/D-amino acid oxidase-like deaminating enzyme